MPCNCSLPTCETCVPCNTNPCNPCTPTVPPLLCTEDCELPVYTNNGCYPQQKTSCVDFNGVADSCIPIGINNNLNLVIANLSTYIKNTLTRLTPANNSILITHTNDACDDKATVRVRIDPDVTNTLELRVAGLFVPPIVGSGATLGVTEGFTTFPGIEQIISGTGLTATGVGPGVVQLNVETGFVCKQISDVLEAAIDDNQFNGVASTLYDFAITDSAQVGDCSLTRVSPPTGFAITGNTRVSAFGKMEWFETLTLANAAAVSGETVLIYNNTTENLLIKDNVNYQGIGTHSIGNSITVSVNASINNLSNLIVNTLTLNGNFTIEANNVSVLGEVTFLNGVKWKGGKFLTTGTTINLSGNCELSHIYSKARISMMDSVSFTNSVVNDSSIANGGFTVF